MLTFIKVYWFIALPVAVIILLKLLKTMRSSEGRADAAIDLKAWAVSSVIWVFFPVLNLVMAGVGSVGHAAPATAAAVVKPATVAPAPAVIKPAVVAPAAVAAAPAPVVAAVAPAVVAPAVAAPAPVVAPTSAVAAAPAVSKPADVAPAAVAAAPAPAPAVAAAPPKVRAKSDDVARKKSEAELDALNSKLGELLRK